MKHGFDLGYKTWVHHGEPDLPSPPPAIDNTRQPQMSDMTALLNDLSYIPPNNEHNEPTQGDIGETRNELTQATRNEFKELYASANEELYLGCDYVTRFDFMEKFTYFKVKGKLIDSIFNEIAWKNFDTKYPNFAKEPRNVRLRLAANGFNPFDNLSQAYSMWPDIDVYLRPLIEDLKFLWDQKGVETIDVASGQKFNMRAMVYGPSMIFLLEVVCLGRVGKVTRQICSATLMEDDMLKAQIMVVNILCDLELIYPPALFDIMIPLVIHLPLEALKSGPIRPRWMFPFERYIKKLKGYVRNKAKSEGSIADGYVTEEALTFSSHYFWDVTTKINHPDRNVDPPPTTCQF
uniref:DUF4218 domain-containing protein n=1 Tax=Tanacetum cinerariifolium TaxID=118510 RepID=A0A699JKV1_TANCI|nr:hypothetical protein [Tanacetum cinerariifolium]